MIHSEMTSSSAAHGLLSSAGCYHLLATNAEEAEEWQRAIMDARATYTFASASANAPCAFALPSPGSGMNTLSPQEAAMDVAPAPDTLSSGSESVKVAGSGPSHTINASIEAVYKLPAMVSAAAEDASGEPPLPLLSVGRPSGKAIVAPPSGPAQDMSVGLSRIEPPAAVGETTTARQDTLTPQAIFKVHNAVSKTGPLAYNPFKELPPRASEDDLKGLLDKVKPGYKHTSESVTMALKHVFGGLPGNNRLDRHHGNILASLAAYGDLDNLETLNLDGHPLPVKDLKGIKQVELIDLSEKKLGIASAVVIASLVSYNIVTTSLK
jgi:hypothetical protein